MLRLPNTSTDNDVPTGRISQVAVYFSFFANVHLGAMAETGQKQTLGGSKYL